MYLTEVTYCPFIFESLTEFFSFLCKAVHVFIFTASLLDLRGNFEMLLLPTTVVVPPFINLLLVLDSEALSDCGAVFQNRGDGALESYSAECLGKDLWTCSLILN